MTICKIEGCKIEGCNREVKVKGMCKPHYVAAWKKENVSIEKREGNDLYNVWCSKAKNRSIEWGSFERFKQDVGAAPGESYRLTRLDKKLPWGADNVEWAKVWVPVREDESPQEYSKRAIQAHKRREKYGVDSEMYDRMYKSQNGLCKLCQSPERSKISGTQLALAVDHDHKTGRVRGLLCTMCNMALGSFRDDVDVIKSAIQYLEHHNGTQTENDSRPQAQEENEGC